MADQEIGVFVTRNDDGQYFTGIDNGENLFSNNVVDAEFHASEELANISFKEAIGANINFGKEPFSEDLTQSGATNPSAILDASKQLDRLLEKSSFFTDEPLSSSDVKELKVAEATLTQNLSVVRERDINEDLID